MTTYLLIKSLQNINNLDSENRKSTRLFNMEWNSSKSIQKTLNILSTSFCGIYHIWTVGSKQEDHNSTQNPDCIYKQYRD